MGIVSELKKPRFLNASAGPPIWALSAGKVSISVSDFWSKTNYFQSVSFSGKDESLAVFIN